MVSAVLVGLVIWLGRFVVVTEDRARSRAVVKSLKGLQEDMDAASLALMELANILDTAKPESLKLAIVGSTSLEGNKEAETFIRFVLTLLAPLVVISGGAKGIDQMAVRIAKECGIKTQEFLPAAQIWPEFKKRNLRIAQECDRLIRIVDKNSKTYGSGWTRDRAEELGKLTYEFVVAEESATE